MATMKPGILILSPFFSPNIGGVETHLDDLSKALQNYSVFVLTYSPITTPHANYKIIEHHQHLHIIRLPHFGQTLFHQFEKYPLLQFLYLTPYLLSFSLLWMFLNSSKIHIIHSHGFNATFIGNILAAIFNKRHLTSTHAVYQHIRGFSQQIVTNTLSRTSHILCLSQASANQLIKWGINPKQISLFRYWIDLQKFTPKDPPKKFTVLYVGRLITKKGIRLILRSATKLPSVEFHFVGTGPEEKIITKFAQKYQNIKFFGPIQNHQLPKFYQQASVLCLPSLYPEGYGRVVVEAVASGLPVIASNTAGLREALNLQVALLIKPTTSNIIQAIKKIKQPKIYQSLRSHCRPYALAKFGPENIKLISQHYEA